MSQICENALRALMHQERLDVLMITAGEQLKDMYLKNI